MKETSADKRAEMKDKLAIQKGYKNWNAMYDWIAREGEKPGVVAQQVEAFMDEVYAHAPVSSEGEMKELLTQYNDFLMDENPTESRGDASFMDNRHLKKVMNKFLSTYNYPPAEKQPEPMPSEYDARKEMAQGELMVSDNNKWGYRSGFLDCYNFIRTKLSGK